MVMAMLVVLSRAQACDSITHFDSLGTLLPRKEFPKGGTSVCIRVEKIKLKDPSQFLDPFITISVKGLFQTVSGLTPTDIDGNDMCPVQDTPVTSSKDEFVHFNQDVYLQVPLENIGKGDLCFQQGI